MKRPARLSPLLGRVSHVPVRARKMVVLGVDWASGPDYAGAIVWLQPGEDATSEKVSAAVERLKAAGAARVVVLPLPSKAAAVPREFVSTGKVSIGAREVVMKLLDEVREQPDEVRIIVTKAIDESGL